MKIRLAIIPPNNLDSIVHLASDLRCAVNAGDVDGVDAVTEQLMVVTTNMRSADISLKKWHKFLNEIRIKDATFQSDYIASGRFFSPFFPEATEETIVLQFPLAEQEDNDV